MIDVKIRFENDIFRVIQSSRMIRSHHTSYTWWLELKIRIFLIFCNHVWLIWWGVLAIFKYVVREVYNMKLVCVTHVCNPPCGTNMVGVFVYFLSHLFYSVFQYFSIWELFYIFQFRASDIFHLRYLLFFKLEYFNV